LPECPIPLLGRDLLTKLRAQITFNQGGPENLTIRLPNALIMAVTTPMGDEWQLYRQEKGGLMKPICLLGEFPDIWAENGASGLACNRAPVMVKLKPAALPVRQRQYAVPREACLGIQTHLHWPKDAGILINCQSPWNTPLLPIKKAGGEDSWPVQDLQAVNNAVITVHSVVPNPYTLLSFLPPQASWFTCLDLKDAVFCLCLAPVSQPLFAFEWEDTHSGRKMQMTWTRIPQGFKNSPTLFREALAVDLSMFLEENPSFTLLQYVDNLLLASHDRETCWEGTKVLLA
jgi:hypothetical protein